jgi:ubiquinone/menaquinone biosynthesis C-methylase UbiE
MSVEEFYNQEAERYDALRWSGPVGTYVHRRYEELAFEAVPILSEGKYLEIGCGTGRFTAPFAAKGINLVAVDISDDMLAATRHKLHQSAVDGAAVQLLKADARALDFPEGEFDVVFSFNVINHIPQYERVISEVARVLRPGGYFIVGFPSLWSLYLPYAMLVNVMRKSLRRGVYTRWPSAMALARQGRSLGLQLESQYGMFHCPPVKNRLIAATAAKVLTFLGRLAYRGPLRAAASTRIMVFRRQPVDDHS